eukprot:1703719-Alexandrium_andersonii.AAC.1
MGSQKSRTWVNAEQVALWNLPTLRDMYPMPICWVQLTALLGRTCQGLVMLPLHSARALYVSREGELSLRTLRLGGHVTC